MITLRFFALVLRPQVACWLAASALWSAPAHAWDPATTQAGIADKAALASSLHQTLTERLDRPLGLFEPISIASTERDTLRMKLLWLRLSLLSSAEGYRPTEASGANSALGWIAAGAVLEGVPAERGRHHFFDPASGRGLHDNPGPSGGLHSLKLAFDGRGGLRGLATGTTFDLTGQPAVQWVLSPENDLGMPYFLTAMHNAVAAPLAAQRQAALAEALICLGAMGAVLADMGEPAHVRNDFRGAFLNGGSAGSWDQRSDFERFVANRYGRSGVPNLEVAAPRTSLQELFSAKDGKGLADRTHSKFFSAGTLPSDVPVDAATTPKEVRVAANDSLPFPDPPVDRLWLHQAGRQYQKVNGVRLFAYERLAGSVRFFLDDAVYADTAQAWLPIVGGYVAGLYNHLVRAQLELALTKADGMSKLSVTVKGLLPGATGTLRLYAQTETGSRKAIGAPMEISVLASGAEASAFSFQLPPDASRVAVSVRGKDAGGDFVAVAERGVR